MLDRREGVKKLHSARRLQDEIAVAYADVAIEIFRQTVEFYYNCFEERGKFGRN